MNIEWQCKPYRQLSVDQLYELLRLRSKVFVVEQQCVYLDIDDLDQNSWHLLGCDGGVLAVYARIFVQKGRSVIGRIVTAPSHRGVGLGKEIMHQAIAFIRSKPQELPKTMYLMAQHHLEKFYQSFGFNTISEPFDEDGILHIDMECVNER